MNLLFIGLQGSGKGTQAKLISKELGIPHISTGDLLREVSGDLKEKIDSYICKGNLVPDNLIVRILNDRIKRQDCEKGFILDGFPRNLKQAEILDKIVKIDKVVEIEISDETAKKRLKARWNCKNCGIAYNLITSPVPKKKGFCDICNSRLFQREDDKDDSAIEKRIRTYHKETEPILNRYSYIKANGELGIEEVKKEILKKLRE